MLPNRFEAVAVFRRQANGDVELAVGLQQRGRDGAAQRRLNDGVDVAGIEAVAGGLFAVDLDVQIGLAEDLKIRRDRSMPLTCSISCRTWVASCSRIT